MRQSNPLKVENFFTEYGGAKPAANRLHILLRIPESPPKSSAPKNFD
jgi:hypothetical protein